MLCYARIIFQMPMNEPIDGVAEALANAWALYNKPRCVSTFQVDLL